MESSLESCSMETGPVKLARAILIFGPPGTDRGTQCQKICESFGFVRITPTSIVNRIRDTPGMRYHDVVAESFRSNRGVPGHVFCDFIKDVIKAEMPKTTFLIESFPCNREYLYSWMQKLAKEVKVVMVINLNCPKATCVERIIGYKPISTGKDIAKRNEAELAVHSYMRELRPVIDYYRNIGIVLELDTLLPAERVFDNIQAKVKTLQQQLEPLPYGCFSKC